MKKFLALFLAIIIAITLVSCLDQKDTPTPAPDGGDASTTTTTTATTTTAKDNTPKLPLGYPSGGGGEPPTSLPFESVKEIQSFITAATGTEEEFNKYHAEEIAPLLGITYKASQAVYHNLGLVQLPMISSETTLEGFGASYNLSDNIFNITYRINGIRYRFIYRYNETGIPEITTAKVYNENARLGDTSLVLYEGQGCLFGYFNDNSIRVELIIYTEDFESVSLDVFEMAPIESIK